MDVTALSQARMMPDMKALGQSKCFHGFAQAVEPKAHMFELQSKIGSGSCGQVFRAKCATDRKCDIAIKVIPLTGWMTSHAYDEKEAVQALINNPHPNIIEYFGVVEESDKIHIVMELGEENFAEFLSGNITKLSISQFHEIMFQILEILHHLDSINIFHNDFKTRNMVLLKKKIKLVDFDLITDKETRKKTRPFSRLVNAAYFLSELQLEMKCKSKDKEFFNLRSKIFKTAKSVKFNEACAKNLYEDDDIWHEDLPLETRKILSRCFVYDESIQRAIIKERYSITPRSELVF